MIQHHEDWKEIHILCDLAPPTVSQYNTADVNAFVRRNVGPNYRLTEVT